MPWSVLVDAPMRPAIDANPIQERSEALKLRRESAFRAIRNQEAFEWARKS